MSEMPGPILSQEDIFFWVGAAILSAVAVMILLHALRGNNTRAARRADYDRAIYARQMEEIQRDMERGTLRAEEAEALRAEIARRLLSLGREDGAALPGRGGVLSAHRGRFGAALVIALPLLALGLYLVLGTPGAPDQPLASRIMAEGEQAGIQPGIPDENAIAAMVEGLAQKLEQDPDDREGWRMLGRSYRMLGRLEEARAALAKAAARFPDDAGILSDYAVILIEPAPEGFTVGPQAEEQFRRVLELSPDAGEALWFLGFAEVQRGEKEKALGLWRKLLEQVPSEAQAHAALKGMIEALEKAPAGNEATEIP